MKDKYSIEKAMHSRRLVFHSMEADFAETERLHKQKVKEEAKKVSNAGTVGFKATERGRDWQTLIVDSEKDCPGAASYSPRHDFVMPILKKGFTGYGE